MAPFALGFSPHVQREACTDLLLCAHAVDLLLHLARAPVAAFHRIGRGGQQLLIEKRQRFFQRGGQELLQRVAQLAKPLETTTQCGQLAEGCLGPTASLEQRVHLFHDLPQLTELRQPLGDAPQRLACTFAQVMLDKQLAMGEQSGALLFQPLFLAGGVPCRFRARASFGQFGLFGREALACAGHGTSDGFDHLGHDMTRTNLMRHVSEDCSEGLGIQRRPIGRDAQQRQVAGRQGRFQSS